MRMIRAKNYETVFKFVKVMPRKLVLLFFWTRCISFVWSLKVVEKSLNLILTNGQEPCPEVLTVSLILVITKPYYQVLHFYICALRVSPKNLCFVYLELTETML